MRLNYIDNVDCLEGMRHLPDNSIDLVVTDPPYLINYSTNRRKDKNHDFCSPIANDNNPDLIDNFLVEVYSYDKMVAGLIINDGLPQDTGGQSHDSPT